MWENYFDLKYIYYNLKPENENHNLIFNDLFNNLIIKTQFQGNSSVLNILIHWTYLAKISKLKKLFLQVT